MISQKHILSIYVRNKAGVMSQVSGLFTRRGYNIDSVAVGVSDDPKVSSMTIILKGSEDDLLQFQRQLLKLPDIIRADSLPYHGSAVRELVLIRVNALPEMREEIFGLTEVFQGKISEITEDSMLIEVHGASRSINGIISMLKKFGIQEMARTGQIALPFKTDNG